jgi:hypothetical protein
MRPLIYIVDDDPVQVALLTAQVERPFHDTPEAHVSGIPGDSRQGCPLGAPPPKMECVGVWAL